MTATGGNYTEGMATVYQQGLYEESATKKHRLGTIRVLDDGRKFVYCSATAAAIAAGVALSKAQAVQTCTIAAADAAINLIGARTVTLTLTGTPTAGLYEDGYMVLTAGTGIGEIYKIKSNTADDVPASGRCTFYLYDALKTTHVTATTTVSVYQNPYKSLLINPAVANEAATTQETVMGVTVRPVTASYYFWAQTWGLSSLTLDIDAAAGGEANEMDIVQGTTSGRGRIVEDTAFSGAQVLGYSLISADHTDAQSALVFLTIS